MCSRSVSIGFSNDRFSPYTLCHGQWAIKRRISPAKPSGLEYSTSCHPFQALPNCSSAVVHESQGGSATHRYFQVLSAIHDIDEHFMGSAQSSDLLSSNVQIFACHWGHLAVIFIWLSSNLFHVGFAGNYEVYCCNPIKTLGIAHTISDPHFSEWDTYVLSTASVYNLLYTSGLVSTTQLYNFVIFLELIAICSMILARTGGGPSLAKSESRVAYPTSCSSPLNGTAAGRFRILSGLSILWFGHLEAVAIPFSRGRSSFSLEWIIQSFQDAQDQYGNGCSAWGTFLSAKWYLYGKFIDAPAHIPGSSLGAGRASLTFLGGLEPITGSLFIADQAHHHLAIGLVFLLLAQGRFAYPMLYAGGGERGSWPKHQFRRGTISLCVIPDGPTLLPVNTNSGQGAPWVRRPLFSFAGADPAYGTRLQESVALAGGGLAVFTSAVAQHIYSMTPYYYLSYDYCASVALYVHHQYISAFLVMILPPHFAILLTREEAAVSLRAREPKGRKVITRIGVILEHKAQLISHLSWLCLWLGFHTLGVFVYNDTCFAFGRGLDSILIEPAVGSRVCGQGGSSSFQALFGCGSAAASLKSFGLSVGPGDWESHHAIALALHTSVLIALKGSLDSAGSRMMPDKGAMPYSFACDGPGRGGTCDISAWDSFYLAMFWVLNTLAWITFYFHYKHLTLWSRGALQFGLSSTYLNGWFRDYLWFNSASLIDGYNALGANDLSASAFGFLAAHLSWATGFMFLIAWRGYWQECVDVILYMHLKTPILYDLWSAAYYTPLALSIVQARLIGLSHFSVGFILTYATFVLGATS